jgi:hypothetical protein
MVVLSKLHQSLILSTSSIALVRRMIRAVISNFNWYLNSKSPKQIELYILSLLHASVITCWGIKHLPEGGMPQTNILEDDKSIINLLIFSMGYFIHDIIGAYMIGKSSISGTIHHIIGIIIEYSMSTNLNFYKTCYPIFISFAITELSTIFLNIMLIMRHIHKSNTRLYNYIVATFTATFFGTRIVANPLILVYNWSLLLALGKFKWLIWAFPALNCWWFKIIVTKFVKVLKKKE